jgi:hypothetical protein
MGALTIGALSRNERDHAVVRPVIDNRRHASSASFSPALWSMGTPIEDGTALETHQACPTRRIATLFRCPDHSQIAPRSLNYRSRQRCDRAIHGEEVNSEAHSLQWLDPMKNARRYRLSRVRAQNDIDVRLTGKHKAKVALTDPKYSPRSVTDAV